MLRAQLVFWRTGAVVLLVNCAILVLQLVTGRLLSPFIGVSLATWTAVIGVFLLGISVGNWLGGTVADRWPTPRTLGWLLILGSVSTGAVLGLARAFGDGGHVLSWLPLHPRIAVLAVVIGLPPSLVLSMITPLAIRLLLPDARHAGRIAGLVYALGTLGSLAGTFLTGFVLIAALSVRTIVIGTAAVLALLAAAGDWWRATPRQSGVGPSVPSIHADRPGATPAHPAAPELAGHHRLAGLIVAIASFCTMAIELAASRLLAPYVGVSLYTWTGIIGVVLAGIALGNFLGGQLADRWPASSALGACLFCGGLACLGIVPLLDRVMPHLAGLGLIGHIVGLSAALFFLPVVLLGTISPQVIRLAISDVAHSGRIAGRLYAWSTAGAIAGTFAVGWVLIGLLGVNRLIVAAGLVLLALGVVVAEPWRGRARLAVGGGLAAAGALAGGLLLASGAAESRCALETNYFCIRTFDLERQLGGVSGVRALMLDHFVHAYVKLDDPTYLLYEHEEVHAELTDAIAARTPAPHVLLIGGGGYTYPRWVDRFIPDATMEVVEIDPGVTETAYSRLALPRATRIRSYNMDGRQFVQELAPRGHYELVVQHASNDLSVPYHLMTREYDDAVRAILTDDGVFLVTVTDRFRDGQLLRATIRTMRQSFPEVELLAGPSSGMSGGVYTFVVYGSTRPLDMKAIEAAAHARRDRPVRTQVLPRARLDAYVAGGPQIVLSDEYAPVDNLVSVLYRTATAWGGL